MATEIRVRAERKAGEMLAAMPKATGTRSSFDGRDSSGGAVVIPPENTAPTLESMGVTKAQSSRWQKLAGSTTEGCGGGFGTFGTLQIGHIQNLADPFGTFGTLQIGHIQNLAMALHGVSTIRRASYFIF